MRIIIEGKDTFIKKGTAIDYILSNPFFTKDGNYTLDIEIDLSIPANAQLYRHIERMDVTEKPEHREVIIENNGKIISKGTEIILSVEEDMAKIQIVTDNSELNYLSSERTSIRDINIGLDEVDYLYPLLANFDRRSGVFKLINKGGRGGGGTNPCPTVISMIKRIIEDAGYSIGENYLESIEEYRDLYIVPTISLTDRTHSPNLAKMLPDWSANEFFTEIEKFFNVIFLKKEHSKVISIVSAERYFNDRNNIVAIADKDVKDAFSKTYDTESNLYTNYANVAYELPSKTVYAYSDIQQKTLDDCDTVIFSTELPPDDSAGTYKMYTSSTYGYSAVKKEIEGEKSSKYLLYQCMQFQHLKDPQHEDEVTFKIVPADIVAMKYDYIDRYVMVPNRTRENFEMFEKRDSDRDGENPNDLNYEIENPSEDESVDKVMQIAFLYEQKGYVSHPGRTANEDIDSSTELFKQSCTSNYVAYSSVANQEDTQVFKITDVDKTLNLETRYNKFYSSNKKADTSVEYVFRFLNHGNIYDAKSIYKIRNRLYYCRELRYVLNEKNISEITEGVFYKID